MASRQEHVGLPGTGLVLSECDIETIKKPLGLRDLYADA